MKYPGLAVWGRYKGFVIAGMSVVLAQAVSIFGLVINLKKRRKAERLLRETEERMKLAAEAAQLGLWEWDIASDKVWGDERSLERIGPGNEKDSGYSRFLRTVYPQDRDGLAQAVAKATSGGGNLDHVYRRVLSGERVTWIASRGRVEFDAARKPVKMRGVSMDVTARKLAEEQMQRSQEELAHLGRVATVSQLAGSLAHELNQPLTTIVINAGAVERLSRAGKTDELRDAMKDIAEQGQRAGEIIAAMRAMLKKDGGQMAAQDVNRFVVDALVLVRGDLKARHVTPVLRLDPQLPSVMGNGVQLRQVLLNLMMNACDAMADAPSDKRTLTIESKRATAEEVELSVSDSGSGFSEEMLKHAFEPFNTTKEKGLGLGLTICRSITTAHGGRLMATNNGDRGATVRLTLPVHRAIGL